MQARSRLLVAFAALAFFLAGEGRASAETIPPFDLNRRTASAEWIAHGRLDAKGRLTVDATLKGKAAKKVELTNGPHVFGQLNDLEKRATSIEVVVYLRRSGGKWEVEQGDNGAVGFLGNGVCLVREDLNNLGRWGATMGRHPTLTRESFLKNARAAVAALGRRKILLGLPASADRIGKIAAFWLTLDRDGRYHHSGELSRALRPLVPVEEKALVALLKSSDAASRPPLLELLRGTGRGKAAFDAVAELLDRRQPRAVRRAAIEALAHIDLYRAQERLIPLLRVDEPELQRVLLMLSCSNPARPNPVVVEPLRKLTTAVRRLHRDDREALEQESSILTEVLGHYRHTSFLPLLLEWTLSDNHVTAKRAGAVLGVWTGHSPREDAPGWDRWWREAKPLVEARYDFRRAAGRRKWYRAYRSADARFRPLLLRVWAFEPFDERGMVGEAGGEGGDVAKVVLAALWMQGRLSSVTKGDLVEKFLAVRLEEVPGHPIERYRHLRIVGEKHFPFPPDAWVHSRASIAIGDDREPILEGSTSTSSLGGGIGGQVFGSMSGGSYPGTSKARALLELRDAVPGGDGKAVWKRAWKLGPVRLREAQ